MSHLRSATCGKAFPTLCEACLPAFSSASRSSVWRSSPVVRERRGRLASLVWRHPEPLVSRLEARRIAKHPPSSLQPCPSKLQSAFFSYNSPPDENRNCYHSRP